MLWGVGLRSCGKSASVQDHNGVEVRICCDQSLLFPFGHPSAECVAVGVFGEYPDWHEC